MSDSTNEEAGDQVFPRPAFSVKFLNGFSQAVETLKFMSYELFVLFFYSQVLGLSGKLTGMAILISMIVDAITDPVVGSWSDSVRSRFGRRHLPMVLSILPVGLFLFLLFAPPTELAEWGLFAWLTIVSICLRTAFTFFAAPAHAVTAELSPYADDRAEMGIYRQLLFGAAQIGLLALAFDYFFSATEAFPNGQENPAAYPQFGMAAAGIIMFFMVVTVGGTWKHILRFERNLRPAARGSFSVRTALKGWVEALGGSKNFRAIFFGLLLASTMGSCYRGLSLYLGTYLWELEPGQIKVWQQANPIGMFTVAMLALVMAVGLRRTVRRIEPKFVYLSGYLLLLGAYALPPALTLLGLLPPASSPSLAYILYGFSAVAGAGASLIMICSLILFAEAADEFFFVNAISKTGMLFGLVTFGNKAASGTGKFIAGWLTDSVGFPTAANIHLLTPEILFNLVLWLVIITIIMGVAGFLMLRTYHLSRERHAEVLEGIRKLTAQAAAD
jgi:GPH family glycoside/pentoside/hexuronide:cation symporter